MKKAKKTKEEIQLKVKWKNATSISNNGIKEPRRSIGYSCKQWNCTSGSSPKEWRHPRNVCTVKEAEQSQALLTFSWLDKAELSASGSVRTHMNDPR